MAATTEFWQARAQALDAFLADLLANGTGTFEAQTYTSADLDRLAQRLQLWQVKAAIAAVLKHQSYTLNGVTFTKAHLRDLRAQERELEQQVTPARRGFGVREAVPR